jgi:hypothetical protein
MPGRPNITASLTGQLTRPDYPQTAPLTTRIVRDNLNVGTIGTACDADVS